MQILQNRHVSLRVQLAWLVQSLIDHWVLQEEKVEETEEEHLIVIYWRAFLSYELYLLILIFDVEVRVTIVLRCA